MAPPSSSNAALGELTDVLGAEGARTVVRTFLQAFPSMLHELARGDRERSRRAAHGLKSSARQMGAVTLSEHMAALETRLGRPDEKITATDLSTVAAKFAESAASLRAFVKSGK